MLQCSDMRTFYNVAVVWSTNNNLDPQTDIKPLQPIYLAMCIHKKHAYVICCT